MCTHIQYNTLREVGVLYMPQENKDIVKKYHEKLNTIRVRVPAPDEALGIPDYTQKIRDRAKALGFINKKGSDKGEGSANAYILHLIETDLGIEMIKGMKDLKKSDTGSEDQIDNNR